MDAIINQARQVILVCDAQGRIIRASSYTYRYANRLLHEAFDEALHIRMLEPNGGLQRLSISEILEKGRSFYNQEVLFSTPQGDIPMLLNARPLWDETIMGCVLVFTDISERKRAEEEREQLLKTVQDSRDELEDRVRERTAKLKNSETRLRSLASELINAQEMERKRIAHELHDSLAAQLAAIKYRLERKRDSGESPDNPITMDEIIADVQSANQETRRIMANLRPSILDDLGILPALSWYFRETEKAYPGTSIEYAGGIEENEIPDDLKIIIFRVIQESITNAVRHGQSSSIRIGLERSNGWLQLEVKDNGRGFESATRNNAPTGGMGLVSMQQRIESRGGIFSIRSNLGKGTVVRGEWKLGPRPGRAALLRTRSGDK